MEVSRETLVELLELQKIDSLIDRLEALKRALPEQAELEALQERLAGLERRAAEQQAVVDEIALRQKRLDSDIDSITAKIDAEEAKLHSGNITNPKELTDLQREVESLKRRRSTLEDQDLEVMEEREEAEKLLAPMISGIEELRGQIDHAASRRDRAGAEVVTQLEGARFERERWAPKFASDLLEHYDGLRSSKGGVGVAALVDGVCQGCHMRLPMQEFERVRGTAGIAYCDECRRILVVLEPPRAPQGVDGEG